MREQIFHRFSQYYKLLAKSLKLFLDQLPSTNPLTCTNSFTNQTVTIVTGYTVARYR
jgi:hypothetical protein